MPCSGRTNAVNLELFRLSIRGLNWMMQIAHGDECICASGGACVHTCELGALVGTHEQR